MFTASELPDSRTGVAQNGEIKLPWEQHCVGGEPLLLVNGLSSPRVAYDHGFVAELLNAGFDVVRFDNRDAGRASATSGGYELADMAADAVAVLDSIGWETAHVFGMSMGGMIVQQLGVSFAPRLRTITSLMSTTGNREFGRPTPEAMDALMTPSPTDRDAWLDQRVATERIWASPALWSPDKARARGETLFDYGVQPEGVKHQYKAVVDSGNRDAALAHVQIPTLVLHGSHDTLIQPDGGRHTAEVMPNAEYVELPGMGHDLPAEYWPRITSEIVRFVGAAGFGLA